MKIEILDEQPPSCGHRYTERSARDKLTRHHQRGDHTQRMFSHDDHWHVENAEDYPPYLTGDGCVHLWRSPPTVDDCCLRCGCRYGDLPIGMHEVDPAAEQDPTS